MTIIQQLAALMLGVSLSTPIAFVAGVADPNYSTVVANPNTVTADGAAAALLTFTARDALNNVAPGVSVSLSASGPISMFGATSGATDANGQFETTLKSTVSQTKTVRATFAGSSHVDTAVTFVPGPASVAKSRVVVNPNSTIANNSNMLVAVLTLTDAQSNPISGVTPVFSASGPSTIVSTPSPTSASGQSQASYQTALAQNENAQVTAGGISLAAPMVFIAGPPTPDASSIVINPNSVIANNTSTAAVTVTARDAQGNPVGATSVALMASGTANTFGAASGLTNASGQFATSLAASQAQNENITATLNGNAVVSAPISFVAVTGSSSQSTLTLNRTNQVADNSNFITASLVLKDPSGTPIANQAASWSVSGTATTVVQNGNTDASGVATATFRTAKAQSQNILTTSAGLTLSAAAVFEPGPPSGVNSFFYTMPTRQLANNSNTVTAYLALMDAYNNAIAGQATTFSASGTNTTISGSMSTDGNGLAQATYKTSIVQNQNAQVTAGGATFTSPVVFTGIPAKCVLSVNPNSQTADGNSTVGVTATVTDNSNQPVPNIATIFSSTGAAQHFSPQNVITAPSGQAMSNLSSLFTGTNTLFAQAANVQCAAQANFVTRTPYCTGNPNYTYSNYAAGSVPAGIITGDLNNDGLLDLAVVNNTGNTMSILLGNSNGTFQAASSYAAGTNPQGIAVSDLNNDG
ncbi:MAG: hypothetical protein EOO38_08120, partial [Cytophagaceae bacterium]